MNKLKLLLLFSIGLVCASLSEADAPAKFMHLTTEHGLLHNSVYAMEQDSLGFMWIGTQAGLNRFDGYQFLTFQHDPLNPNSLSSNNFGKILADKQDKLWLGTWGGGLDRLDLKTGNFKPLAASVGDSIDLTTDRIWFLYEDSHGTMWAGTTGHGMLAINPHTDTYTRYMPQPDSANTIGANLVKCMAEDRQGNLWLGLPNGLDRLDPKTEKFTHYRHNPRDSTSLSWGGPIQNIEIDADGILWIGMRGGGLNRLDPKTGIVRRFRHDPANPNSLSDDQIECIYLDSYGSLWIGTFENGLNRFDRQRGTFTVFRHDPADPHSLSHDRIQYLYEDRNRNLWIATRGGGLNILDLKPRKFNAYLYEPQKANTLPNANITALAEDSAGTLWIGTESGLARLDRRRQNYTHYMTGERVWQVYAEGVDTLWAGTYQNGVKRLIFKDGKADITEFKSNLRDSTALSDRQISAICRDQDGDIWIGTMRGLNRVIKTAAGAIQFERYFEQEYISVLYPARDGLLWIGMDSGLRCYDKKSGAISHYRNHRNNPKSLSDNNISAICEDAFGNLWVGAKDTGLNRFDRETRTFAHYYEKDGLANNTISAILPDAQGNLWISTERGLSKFEIRAKTFRNYDQSDGLPSANFIWRSGFKSRTGEIFLGTNAGFITFFPYQVRDNPMTAAVMLTSCKKFDREAYSPITLPYLRRQELSYQDNFIAYEFSALDFTQPVCNQYAYQLEGFDQDWVNAGTRHYASYTNLPDGTYTFRVRGSNSDGVWSKKDASLTLVVKPPWWRTWWSYSLFLMFAVGALIGYIRYKTQRQQAELKQQRRELERERELAVRLEQKVTERTLHIKDQNRVLRTQQDAMEAKNTILTQTLQKLQETQTELIHAEKMSALGKLVANIAHEINTPLGAIRASTDNIQAALQASLSQLPTFFERLGPDERREFAALLAHGLTSRQQLSSRDERQFRRALTGQLTEQGVADATLIAELLVKTGVYDGITPFLALLKSATALTTVEMAYHIISQQRHSDNIKRAVDRAAKIVFALKTYTRYDASGQMQRVQISDTIEIVLTLYESRLKHDIALSKRYDEVPSVFGHPDQLTQVWTNLIHNALQAMGNKGKLEIKLYPERNNLLLQPPAADGENELPHTVVVAITDDGPGIPDDIKSRIFEPFFTTRPTGEGSGLGLEIVRRIVDIHKGQVYFESAPGKTTFWVRLPAN